MADTRRNALADASGSCELSAIHTLIACASGSLTRRCVRLYSPFRALWMNWTTIEPSPTAEATRFTEPLRTSPTA